MPARMYPSKGSEAPPMWSGRANPVRGQLVRDDAQAAWVELREAARGHQLPCSEAPDLHYPDPHDDKRIARAVKLCESCPVMVECQTFAVLNREEFGIWGATTERARRSQWRREQRARDTQRRAA